MNFLTKDVIVQHMAVESDSQEHADQFFSVVLGLQKVKSTLLSKELSAVIFKISKEVRFDLYDNGNTRFEVFINHKPRELTFAHICIEVDKKNEFINRCKEQGLEPFFVQKGDKELLFVRDFSNNLFEVVEKKFQ